MLGNPSMMFGSWDALTDASRWPPPGRALPWLPPVAGRPPAAFSRARQPPKRQTVTYATEIRHLGTRDWAKKQAGIEVPAQTLQELHKGGKTGEKNASNSPHVSSDPSPRPRFLCSDGPVNSSLAVLQ